MSIRTRLAAIPLALVIGGILSPVLFATDKQAKSVTQ
jgi:hypothetical protein